MSVPHRFDRAMGQFDVVPLLRIEGVENVWEQVVFLLIAVGDEQSKCPGNVRTG